MKKNFIHYITRNYFIAVLLLLASCGTPVLDKLTPASGPIGTLVTVDGSHLLGASVYWDYGRPTQQVLPSDYLSAHHFTVPFSAPLGPHPVRLGNGSDFSSNTIDFNVTTGVVRPKPRIDYLTCYSFNIDANNKAGFVLMVSGANIDAGATINVNGKDMPSFILQSLTNTTLTATDPSTLGYPIFNYCMSWCLLNDQTPGAALTVVVKDLFGDVSEPATYNVAPAMALLDSDGDGLLDDWENNGYDANGDGTVDVDLKALGANPNHKDLFVEVDWMSGFAPNNAVWPAVTATYANAPILNADGVPGIAIHVDWGQQGGGGGGGSIISMSNYIRYDGMASINQVGSQTTANFYALKTANFNANRLNVFRYCIFANMNGIAVDPTSSGQAENIWSNDFFVSLGGWSVPGGTVNQQTGTFLHELGHTLGLFHGGFEDKNFKPSYNSIMRYGTPGQLFGIDVNCNNAGDNVYTYSQGMRASLDETSLNENNGVCDHNSIDWNGTGGIQTGVMADINPGGDGVDGSKKTIVSFDVLKDFADWGNLKLNFTAPGSLWLGN